VVQQSSGVEIRRPSGFPVDTIIETVKKSGNCQLHANADKSLRLRIGDRVLDCLDTLMA
jgi:hypothetical protein